MMFGRRSWRAIFQYSIARKPAGRTRGICRCEPRLGPHHDSEDGKSAMLKGIGIEECGKPNEAEERLVAESVLSYKTNVPAAAAKLVNKSDSDVVVRLFVDFQALADQNLELRRQNRDLLSQLAASVTNYSKIKEELEAKFHAYKRHIKGEILLKDVENQKVFNELRQRNEELSAENASLKTSNAEMAERIKVLETTVAELKFQNAELKSQNSELVTTVAELKFQNAEFKFQNSELVATVAKLSKKSEDAELQNSELVTTVAELKFQNSELVTTVAKLSKKSEDAELQNSELVATSAKLSKKLEDIEFQNYIADVFRYIRDGIVAKASSATFPNGSDCMSLLYSSQVLAYPDEDGLEESEQEERDAAITEVEEKRAAYGQACEFLTSLGLDPSLVRDLRIFNKGRHVYEEDCKLKTKFKITSRMNQNALRELRTVLERLDEGHAAFPLKARLLAWCDSVIVEN